MKPKEILVFGASGFIGRNLIRRLTKNNYKVIAVTRNIHQKGYILKTESNPGYLDIVEIKSFEPNKIRELMRGCNVCVNLIGILYEKKNGQFNKFHRLLPDLISKIASESDINQLVHISSLGIENAKDSIYASSKLNGEEAIKTNFERYVILKPSICYGSSDKFTTKFMSLLSLLPFMPLYYKGKTKFAPIHVSDFVEIIFQVIQKDLNNLTIECVGPEIMSFEKMLKTILKSIDKKRLLFPLPYQLAKLSAKLFQLMPEPLLTEDQLKLLRYDNILSGKYKTNFELGFKSEKKFENEINKYSYNWRVGGQFSNKKEVV
tara:strand:- start:1387 stop:2343 length:957 start_codon:yes stop_codon:yes gene_type:complete